MHRETLSRSLILSHSLMGKSASSSSLVPLNLRGAMAILGKRSVVPPSSSRSFHRSWMRLAHSSMIEAEAVGKSVDVASSDEVSNPGRPFKRQFNLKAKDILGTPDDEPLSPSSPRPASVNLPPVPPVAENYNTDYGYNYNPSSSVTEDRTLLETKIYATRSFEDLLNYSNLSELTLKHACLIIARLGHLSIMKPEHHKQITEKVLQDVRFTRIFNLIQRGNHSQYPHTLLLAITGLQKLGLQNSPEVSRLLERELSWSMRRCPLRFLAKAVVILHDSSLREASGSGRSQGTKDDEEEGILRSAIQVLHRRWIEAITGSDFISLFKAIHLFDDDRKLKIEERAADLAHQFTPNEMARIFVVLGSKRRRPTPLLRALSFHYSKSDHKISAKDTIDLIYALNELTFADPILMNRLCTDLCDDIPTIKHVPLISSLLTSLGQMRYRQKDILYAVDEWIMKHLNELRVFDYAAWLQAATTLNHQSQNLPLFCDAAKKVLTQSSASSPTEWVNIVHSFVILDKFDNQMLSSVLNPEFVNSIEGLGVKATRQKVKLLNLNHIARHQSGKDFTGPFLPESKVKEWTVTVVNSSDEKLSQLMAESLGNFLPSAKYLELNCQLESGVFVDAKCYIDSKMKPVTLDQAQSQPSSVKPIAIVVEGYPSLCLGQKLRTGQSSLNMKILENEQYLVVTVPYTEFSYSDKLIRRVQYLEQKIKNISQSSESIQSS